MSEIFDTTPKDMTLTAKQIGIVCGLMRISQLHLSLIDTLKQQINAPHES